MEDVMEMPETGVEDVAQEPAAEEATQQQIDDAIELAIKGQTHRLTKSQLAMLAELGIDSHEKFQKAHEAEQHLQQLAELIQSGGDLSELFKAFGADPTEWAKKLLLGKIEEESEPEEKRELKRLKEENEKFKSEAEKKKAEAEKQAHIQRFETEIPKALEELGMSTDSVNFRRVIKQLNEAYQAGYDLPIPEAARRAKQSLIVDVKETIAKLPQKELLEVLGPEVIRIVRQAELQKVSNGKSAEAPKKPAGGGRFDELFAQLQEDLR